MRVASIALIALVATACATSPRPRRVDVYRVELRGDGPCAHRGVALGGDRPSLSDVLDEAKTGKPVPPPPACDAARIEIARACHCVVSDESSRPWGKTDGLSLELPRKLRVMSGRSVPVPFTLRNRGKQTLELDFVGGEVIVENEIRRGKKRVEGASCSLMSVLPDPVRLTLRPGAVVRGALDWSAMNSQIGGPCAEMATDLAPGRYQVTFETVSGTPPLSATVNVEVRKSRR